MDSVDNKQKFAYEKRNINSNLNHFRLNLFINGLISNPLHSYASQYIVKKLYKISNLSEWADKTLEDRKEDQHVESQHYTTVLENLRQDLIQIINKLVQYEEAGLMSNQEYTNTLKIFAHTWESITKFKVHMPHAYQIYSIDRELEDSLKSLSDISKCSINTQLLKVEEELTKIAQTFGQESLAYREGLKRFKQAWEGTKGRVNP